MYADDLSQVATPFGFIDGADAQGGEHHAGYGRRIRRRPLGSKD